MASESSVSQLRAAVKRWEREFETSQGRKPTSADAKADSTAWSLYQKYRAEKKASMQPASSYPGPIHPQEQPDSSGPQEPAAPSTPRKKRPHKRPETKPEHTDSASDGSDTENDEENQSLLLQNVSEVFPTPQFRGKVLGLFDVETSAPETPQKIAKIDSQSPTSSSPCPRTPREMAVLAETPQSKRTPDYFQYRVNLFPAGGSLAPPGADGSTGPAESPLIKRRQSRTKSVTDIMREASEITRSASVLADEDASASSDDEPNESEELPPLHISADPNILDTVPVMADNHAKGKGRKAPKRQTRRVIMRPVDRANGAVSTAKATDNFVRLKINNKNKRPRRR